MFWLLLLYVGAGPTSMLIVIPVCNVCSVFTIPRGWTRSKYLLFVCNWLTIAEKSSGILCKKSYRSVSCCGCAVDNGEIDLAKSSRPGKTIFQIDVQLLYDCSRWWVFRFITYRTSFYNRFGFKRPTLF